jgi:hypothetical protein
LEFSAEKVLKNHFFQKFHGIFRGKSLSGEKMYEKMTSGMYCVKSSPRIGATYFQKLAKGKIVLSIGENSSCQGSMLCSQFSAIFVNFWRKN